MELKLTEADLKPILARLTPDTPALFGGMNAQNMIEHLAATLRMSNGGLFREVILNEEKSNLVKQHLIYSDTEMPKGIKSSTMGDIPPPLLHESIDDAIEALYQELNTFHIFFKQSGIVVLPVHPRAGKLNYQEWTVFHTKHFVHHFKQFGLLD
jgi:hypothetical protein